MTGGSAVLCDYHMHLEHGPVEMAWLRRFIEVAAEKGIDEIGISEHMFRFRESSPVWPSWWTMRSDCSLAEYVDLIEQAGSMGMPVRLGVEAEYLEGHEDRIRRFLREAPWDYVIGSVHFIGEWGFDDVDGKDEWDSRDVDEAYRRYFHLLEKAMESGMFDVIGHPDVIKVFGHRPSIDLGPYYERAARAAKTSGVAIEISTAGLRKPVSEMYPHPGFLAAFRRWNVPVIISSDAHYPEHVGYEFTRAVEYARSIGYTTVTRFSARTPSQVPLAGERDG
ncbi:MAG: histidinol-phosphatase HisJ family protein [Ignavibacteriales bacterium]